ncbi:MAG: alpha/beta hydrolase-fold protein [Duganella sp.]
MSATLSLLSRFIVLGSLALFVVGASAASAPFMQNDGATYQLPDTEVSTIHAKELKRDYQVFVSLPKGYSSTGPALPVVFVTDADYAFPLVRAITARVSSDKKSLGPFILVGLSYALGDTPEYSRRRDYTPTGRSLEGLSSDMPGRPILHGEAEGYRRFLASDVLPFIAKRYPADLRNTTFVGHSYGALLGAHIVLTTPTLFSKYVISSPSLWYNDGVIFSRQKEFLASQKDLKADIFFSIGSLETASDVNMIADLKKFDQALTARRYPSLKRQLHVWSGKDHFDVFPDMITAALRWAVPVKP